MLIESVNSFNRRCRRFILFCLILLATSCSSIAAYAQTKPAQASTQGANYAGYTLVAPDGKDTLNTVPNPYEDAKGNLYRVRDAVPINQRNIDVGVTKILSGEEAPNVFEAQTNLAFQATEQGQGTSIQHAANNILNASLGSINEFYRGLHQFFKDTIVGNLFQNIGQLNGKWLSEFTGGWVSDTAQYLTRFLKVFVLNPNVAVNGLGDSKSDGISPYIRQGADVMYGIAVDLLLLLFILCIWKNWADASWGGAGNLMGPVGRLIFTAALLLAWPTIYAFEIQITNEMIQAIFANNPEQILMLDFAMAQLVKGGVIAAGAGAVSVFAPVLSKLALPVGGDLAGSVFYFASTMVFTILGGIIIAEIVYILILKAIQTALLTAQYMFAPIFLVFFATPDTESYATGYVRAFVETSLWTFAWVGLLKIMTIILFSNFNPWGKILIAIGVLQLMIQVPSFLGRAQISPVSDFVSAGLVFGTFKKALDGLGDLSTGLVSKGVSWFTNDSFADRGLQQSKNVGMMGFATSAKNPELLHSLNKASAMERSGAAGSKQGSSLSAILGQGPGLKTAGQTGEQKSASTSQAESLSGIGRADNLKTMLHPGKGSQQPNSISQKGIGANTAIAASLPPVSKDLAVLRSAMVNRSTGALVGAQEESSESRSANGQHSIFANQSESVALEKIAPDDCFQWSTPGAHNWNEANLIHVDARKMLSKLTSADGVGIRMRQAKTSAVGSSSNGVQRISIADGATDAEMTHAIYSAAFANNIASDDPARDAARTAAAEAQGQRPIGLMENMCANWMSNTGSSWSKSAIAKQRFQHSMFEQAVKGSQDYISGRAGNAYTKYLNERYGTWGKAQDAEAIHLISNPESSESPWNRNIGPATDALVASGITIDKDTRGAMQNLCIQSMHPARRKQAVFAALSYTYQKAKAQYGDEHDSVFKLGHGEMARSLSTDEVNNALVVFQSSGQADLNSSMAPQYLSVTADAASAANTDFATAYARMASAAPSVARRLGYISPDCDVRAIKSYTDLAVLVSPPVEQSVSATMQTILKTTGSELALQAEAPAPLLNNGGMSQLVAHSGGKTYTGGFKC